MRDMSAEDSGVLIRHGSWGKAAEFFITMLGFAVGLGNVWRFPNVVYQYGGGVFFFPYILAIFFIGVPVFLLESSVGQYSQKNTVQVWDICPMFRGVGIASMFIVANINVYYTAPQAWGLLYFIKSMYKELPWAHCPALAASNCTNISSAEAYYYEEAMKVSSGLSDWGQFNWELLLCNATVWFIIFMATCYGAASLGKVAYFTSLFPYVMITALLIYALTLPGAERGVEFYLKPDVSKLADIRVWSVAVSQVFFSTGIGAGVVQQLSSYNKFHHNVVRDAFLVPCSDALTSFYAGFSVFSILGYMAKMTHKRVEDVVETGPALIFVTYPEAFTHMPGGQVLSVFFFFMVIVLGLSSTVPSVECICSVVSDYVPWFERTRFRNIFLRFLLCGIQFAIGIFYYFGNGFYLYSLMDDRVISYSLMFVGMAEMIALAWFFGPIRILGLIEEMLGSWNRLWFIRYFFVFSWVILCPAGLLFIFILDICDYAGLEVHGYTFPAWGSAIGWIIIAISPIIVIVTAVVTVCHYYKGARAFWDATQPSHDWRKRIDCDEDEEDLLTSPENC